MLSPYTVLDLTDERGELASMILGDLGADVIKIEPPEGSSSRRLPPFLEGAPEAERSLHYFAYNRNKRGITLDLTTSTGTTDLPRLAENADFLFESASPGEMAKLGLGLRRPAPSEPAPRLRLDHAVRAGRPLCELRRHDLTLSAMGGQMILQGDADRLPCASRSPRSGSTRQPRRRSRR